MSTSEPRFPARFAPDPWDEDLARSTPAGRTAAEAARRDYEPNGIPRSHLRPCDEEGRDGTNLPQCFKVYVPHPDGRFGMVFTIDRKADKPTLVFLAFGVRHHPKGSHALTVYQLAHRRLHGQTETEKPGA
jgi:hypothetical protein